MNRYNNNNNNHNGFDNKGNSNCENDKFLDQEDPKSDNQPNKFCNHNNNNNKNMNQNGNISTNFLQQHVMESCNVIFSKINIKIRQTDSIDQKYARWNLINLSKLADLITITKKKKQLPFTSYDSLIVKVLNLLTFMLYLY